MKKMVVVSLHIGYWFLYLFLLFIILLLLQIGTKLKAQPLFFDYRFETFFACFALLPAILGFYTFYSFLFDKFLLQRNIFLLFVSGISASIFIGLLSSTVISVLHYYGIGPGVFGENIYAVITILIVISIISLLNGGMGLLTKGFIRWYAELRWKEELMRKNFEMELALIKSQTSPHFLFNTLNNIDVLITKNAEKASLYLNKLSDIMRYMLYETKGEKILLANELAYIEKYIDLQKIRTANPNFVEFTIIGDTVNVLVSPMILLPFVENAFKHADNRKNENVIRIEVAVEKEQLIFECENKYSKSEMQQEFGGLGNELIKRRLELLYPLNHVLLISKNADIYSVKLAIGIHEN
ncbi:sensor histidine kinase [Emticicia sp. BO119]|uniref:sensor histidine kinase n=1 Tax=Emticicia sp. BO119 TaxID=2757768 RepID=UPI0015EFEDE1|nr:histidine kinase [Emticicia sp. BO119]MBA4848936.1 histidine kinase [Emticicia sp. BO119]